MVTAELLQMAQQTVASITDPIEQGLPMLAMIQDFVLAKFCLFWGIFPFCRAMQIDGVI